MQNGRRQEKVGKGRGRQTKGISVLSGNGNNAAVQCFLAKKFVEKIDNTPRSSSSSEGSRWLQLTNTLTKTWNQYTATNTILSLRDSLREVY